ncbi:uncharacterized protein PRCAT00003124001 [Priceomyces carsonii]|uniref:uncharacterized protein n=1 Tax=Priceomyces carsonii TaxID=28549 RepID=UPI002EDB759E|nr:unnamed protein product [Priceomyces carsonii]
MTKIDSPNDTKSLQMENTPPQVIFPYSESKQLSGPEQKKRRVTRACDNCRQKKVKCDGKQPCIHCTVYSYTCTYDQPHIRNKRHHKVSSPSVASNHNNVQGKHESALPNTNMAQNIINLLLPKLNINVIDNKLSFDFQRLQKMIKSAQSRGPVNLNEIQDMFQDGSSPASVLSDIHSTISPIDDSVREVRLVLPSKEEALSLVYTTWNKACVLFRFYHRPSLLQEIDLLYSLDPSHYTDRQQKFLPFLYSILACGSLFSKSAEKSDNESLEEKGFRYFLEARRLIDITNVGDITSIQTTVMMTIYLQCSARLSTCYLYIGIALRSAIKEGLHRDLSIFQNQQRKFDVIEADTRKRLFYTIYKMDIYINSLLGLPLSLDEDDLDQEIPPDLDDENITRERYLFENQGNKLSSAGCANFHTKLMLILSKVIKELYPIKVKQTPYSPDLLHNKVSELELKLKNWIDSLPAELKPTNPSDESSTKTIPEKFVLANYYLHLSFLNCQIILYRPFIHSISGDSSFQSTDSRSLIRGRNCIKVARMVVKLANKMINQDLLIGTYWFSTYTIFFSIACLVYYFHFANYKNSNLSGANYAGVLFDDDLNIDMIKHDIEIGKRVLDLLKNSSSASLRIYNILNNLFELLNRRTARIGTSETNGNNIPIPRFPAQDVQATFLNFDNINNFLTNESGGVKSYDSGPAYETGETQGSNDSASKLSENEDYFLKNETFDGLSQVPNQQFSNESSAPAETYVPGVMDKLDTQIFGRILPPYMLEENVKRFTGNNNDSQAQMVTPETADFHQLNIGDLDFSLIGESNLFDVIETIHQKSDESQY